MKHKLCSMIALVVSMVIPTVASAEEENFKTFRVLKPELALDAAKAAMSDCRNQGFLVAVSVTDRFGLLQAALRDQLAGPHTPDTAHRKAWTAVSFRTDTLGLSKLPENGEAWAIRGVTRALPLGGGVRLVAGEGDTVGEIRVSGAEDEACAKAGIDAIADEIAF